MYAFELELTPFKTTSKLSNKNRESNDLPLTVKHGYNEVPGTGDFALF